MTTFFKHVFLAGLVASAMPSARAGDVILALGPGGQWEVTAEPRLLEQVLVSIGTGQGTATAGERSTERVLVEGLLRGTRHAVVRGQDGRPAKVVVLGPESTVQAVPGAAR